MAKLGFPRFMAAGHDRGARVLHRMCLDHPDTVEAAILDIIPQHHLLNNIIRRATGRFSWHWLFMIQPFDLPERLMGADLYYFIQKKLAKMPQGLNFFGKDALAEYMRCFRNPGDHPCDVRGLSGHLRGRSRHGHRGFRRRPQDHSARCCCCGERPAASGAITGAARSGPPMWPTSAGPKPCPAPAITCPRRRPGDLPRAARVLRGARLNEREVPARFQPRRRCQDRPGQTGVRSGDMEAIARQPVAAPPSGGRGTRFSTSRC